jgi:predicted outer membrane protein
MAGHSLSRIDDTMLVREAQRGNRAAFEELVRHYDHNGYANFIIYHEKRMQSLLTFQGTKTDPTVAPMVFRPAQHEFISYSSVTGQVEIEARFEKEEARCVGGLLTAA